MVLPLNIVFSAFMIDDMVMPIVVVLNLGHSTIELDSIPTLQGACS
jgi:hypothetical protein